MARLFVTQDDATEGPYVEVIDVDPADGPLYKLRCSEPLRGAPACAGSGFRPGDRFDTLDDAVNAAEVHLHAAHGGRSS